MTSQLQKEYELLGKIDQTMVECFKKPDDYLIQRVVDLFFIYINFDKLVVIKLRNGEVYSFSKNPTITLSKSDMFKLFVTPNNIEMVHLPERSFNPMAFPQPNTKH